MLLTAATRFHRSRNAQRPPCEHGITLCGLRVGHFTLSERPTGCTVVLVDGDGAVGGVLAARRRTRHARDRSARSAQHGRARQRDRALVAAAPTASTPRKASCAISKSRRSASRSARGRRADRAGRDPVRSRIRRQLEDPSDCRLRLQGRGRGRDDGPVAEGNVGAGAGATVGKFGGGRDRAMKAGIGSAAIALPNGLIVGAIVAVNAVGDVDRSRDRRGRRGRAHRGRQDAR